MIIFQNSLMNRVQNVYFYYSINVFTASFYQLNVSLRNKSFFFFIVPTPNFWTVVNVVFHVIHMILFNLRLPVYKNASVKMSSNI